MKFLAPCRFLGVAVRRSCEGGLSKNGRAPSPLVRRRQNNGALHADHAVDPRGRGGHGRTQRRFQRDHRVDGPLQRGAHQGRRDAGGRGPDGTRGGVRRDFNADPPVVTDGPYTEAKELFNGFWILDVSSKDEAKQWAKKVPLGKGVKVEVRRVSESEEFPPTIRGSRRRSSGRPTWPRRLRHRRGPTPTGS